MKEFYNGYYEVMKNNIRNLIDIYNNSNFETYEEEEQMKDAINGIIDGFAETINAPSNWRSIQEELIEDGVDFEFNY